MDNSQRAKIDELRGEVDRIMNRATQRGYMTDDEQFKVERLEDQRIMLMNAARCLK